MDPVLRRPDERVARDREVARTVGRCERLHRAARRGEPHHVAALQVDPIEAIVADPEAAREIRDLRAVRQLDGLARRTAIERGARPATRGAAPRGPPGGGLTTAARCACAAARSGARQPLEVEDAARSEGRRDL